MLDRRLSCSRRAGALALGAIAACFLGACTSPVAPAQEPPVGDGAKSNDVTPDRLTPAAVVREGDVTVSSPADLEALRGVHVLRGALRIHRSELTDLGALESLQQVGSLEVAENPGLASLRGLDALFVVDGDLSLRENPVLTDVDALRSLTVVRGTLTIGSEQDGTWSAAEGKMVYTPSVGNDTLARLSLPALENVGALRLVRNPILEVVETPRLRAIAGELSITFSPRLVSLDALSPALERVGGPLTLGLARREVTERTPKGERKLLGYVPAYGNETFRTARFPALVAVGGLHIDANPRLETVSLPACGMIAGDIEVDGAGSVPTVELPQVHRVTGSVLGDGVSGLRWSPVAIGGSLVAYTGVDVDKLQRLETVEGSLTFIGPQVRSLTGLSRLTRVGSLVLSETEVLTLAGLEQLRTIGENLYLWRNRLLHSTDALTNLTEVRGRVFVDGDRLRRVRLPVLQRVGGALEINDGAQLEQVDLPALETVGELTLGLLDDRLEVARMPKLRETTFSFNLLGGPKSLDGFGALERVGGDLQIVSSVIAQAELLKFAEVVRQRRGVAGNVNVISTAE